MSALMGIGHHYRVRLKHMLIKLEIGTLPLSGLP
jgi:hypothetical protein